MTHLHFILVCSLKSRHFASTGQNICDASLSWHDNLLIIQSKSERCHTYRIRLNFSVCYITVPSSSPSSFCSHAVVPTVCSLGQTWHFQQPRRHTHIHMSPVAKPNRVNLSSLWLWTSSAHSGPEVAGSDVAAPFFTKETRSCGGSDGLQTWCRHFFFFLVRGSVWCC